MVEAGGKQVGGCENTPVRAQVVLLHHLLVVHSVTDVYVGRIRELGDRRVQVDNIRGGALTPTRTQQ